MHDGWAQVGGNRWRKAVQTPHGLLTAEITEVVRGSTCSVHVQGVAANAGLTLPYINSLEEAYEVGDALLVQFFNDGPPTIEVTTTPLGSPR